MFDLGAELRCALEVHLKKTVEHPALNIRKRLHTSKPADVTPRPQSTLFPQGISTEAEVVPGQSVILDLVLVDIAKRCPRASQTRHPDEASIADFAARIMAENNSAVSPLILQQ
ncbi:hypothetical protein [Sinomonas sp. G460-2]|uniref:hypothetical protein n=1 Tax=Sinomonas sp. G460-2 TaxID=3393464 RepID=UPI0039EF883F